MSLDENLMAEIAQASADAAAEAAAVKDGRDPGSVDEGAGDEGAGDEGAGDQGDGDEEAGDQGDGDEEAGDQGDGDEEAGDGEAGDEGAGGDDGGDDGDTKAQQIDDDLMARAIRQGLNPADARSFPDAVSLERVVGRLERLGESVAGGPQGDSRDGATQGSPGQDGEGDGEADTDPFANLPLLNREEYPDDVVNTIEAMTGALREQAKQIKEFQSEIASRREAEQARAAQEVTQWFDGQIEALGDEFADVLGTGGYDSGELTGRQIEARDRVAEKVAVLMQSYQSAGVKVPSREDVFQEAARLALPDVFTEIERKRLAGELRQRSRSHTNRAGSKQTNKSPSPEEEAAAAIDRKFGGG